MGRAGHGARGERLVLQDGGDDEVLDSVLDGCADVVVDPDADVVEQIPEVREIEVLQAFLPLRLVVSHL